MTVETETTLTKLLNELKIEVKESNQRLEVQIKETNQRINKFIETTQKEFTDIRKDLTDIKVGQAKLEGELKILQLVVNTLFLTFIGAAIKFFFFPNV